MNNYLNSNFHRYGVVGAIFGCILTLLGWSIHWFPMLIISYILGGIGSFVFMSLFDLAKDKHTEKEVQAIHPSITQSETQPLTAQPKSATSLQPDQVPIHEKLLLDLQQIERKARPLLNPQSRNLMFEIDDILQFMSKKIKASDDQFFKFEISDIQRTLNSYLNPALAHFASLPSFLRDRKINTLDKTPHELIEQQLALILEELKLIAESIYLNDLNRLVDHGQFLKQKLQQETIFKAQLDQD